MRPEDLLDSLNDISDELILQTKPLIRRISVRKAIGIAIAAVLATAVLTSFIIMQLLPPDESSQPTPDPAEESSSTKTIYVYILLRGEWDNTDHEFDNVGVYEVSAIPELKYQLEKAIELDNPAPEFANTGLESGIIYNYGTEPSEEFFISIAFADGYYSVYGSYATNEYAVSANGNRYDLPEEILEKIISAINKIQYPDKSMYS